MKNIFFYLLLVPFVSFSQSNTTEEPVKTTDSLQNNTEERYSVTLNSSYKQNKFPSFNNNVNIVYDYKKWKINSSIAYGYDKSFWENDRNTYYPDLSFIGKKRTDLVSKSLVTFVDIQYQISKKTKFNVYSMYDKYKDMLTANDKINIYDSASDELTKNYLGNKRSNADYSRSALNFLLKHDFETENNFFTLEGDWNQRKGYYYQNTNGQDYDTNGAAIADRSYVVFNDGDFDFDVYSLNGLINIPTKWFDFSIGGKWVYVELDYDISLSRKFDGDYIKNLALSPICTYIENRQSIFTDLKKTIGKWEFQVGLKFENTLIKGNVLDITYQKIHDKFYNLFPLINAKYSFNDNNKITFSYEKSINRPIFRYINPAIGIYNAYENYTGNPFIKPSLLDNLTLSYAYKSKYDLSFSYSKTKDNIGALANFSPDHVVGHNVLNYFDIDVFQLTGNANLTCLKFIETNFQLRGFYKYNESLVSVLDNTNIWGWYGSINNQFYVNKSKTVSGNLNFWYQSKTIEAEFLYEDRYALDFGIKVLLPKQNLTINFNVTDALRSLNEYAESTVDNINQKFRNYWEPRSFRISVAYKFGNKKLDYEARTAQNVSDYYR